RGGPFRGLGDVGSAVVAIDVDPEGLSGAAAGLGGVQTSNTSAMCVPPAGDPVSVWMAGVFEASRVGVYALLAHAAAQRAAGAVSVRGTAQTLQAADEANAAAISADQPTGIGSMMPAVVAAIPAPMLPPV